ncbi:MAG: radical SAM protein [Candidatus Omnitrophica bacterium]|nr:radical SAM protein [Candidatus Omnitrophota bacterium]MCA9426352.1 radical SAM protein [Candidatus Omnitrophota bacterium]MCA9428993.1 radical SAM protein [Candidatus Omnitrophota bacterium]MCA9436454.1 radical SAM protein [Candidatus Omnitrophota bacterium]MCA9442946.1 radical SAM protein [Candidatus Omnitrophota bacterium]
MQPKNIRGARYILGRLQCWLYVMRRARQKNKYPLLRASGIYEAARMMNAIGIDRWIKWNGSYRQTLVTPLWPSPVYDRFLAKGGLNVDDPGDPNNRRWTDLAMVSITRKCSVGRCRHCSEAHNLGREDVVPIEKLHEVVRVLQERGTGVIALTGGEPFDAPERLLEIIEKGDKTKSEFRVYTTGKGVTAEWAKKLAAAGLDSVLISIDGYDSETHDLFRRKRGVFDRAMDAIRHFQDAGVFVFANVTLTKDLIRGDGLERLWGKMKEMEVPAIQMIEPKTCGGYFQDALDDLFTKEDIERTRDLVRRIRALPGDGPVIYWVDEEERHIGCRAGGMLLFHVDSVGNVAPCVFLPITFGNILEDDFETIFERMREATPDKAMSGCISNQLTPKMLKLFEQGHKVPISYELIQREFDSIYQSEEDYDREEPPDMKWRDKVETEDLVETVPDVPYGF